jgi:CCR4-NOT transcription complex subunit 1
LSSLPNYVTISSKLAELYPEAELRKMVALAIEKAIKEIIQPIVQRNVNIALITTKELILKDFAFEKDANKL